MEKEKKPGHALTRKLPIIAMLLWLFVAMMLQTTSGIALAATGWFAANDKSSLYLGVVIGAIVFLLLMKLWYRPAYKGVMRPALSWKKTLLYTTPMLAYIAVTLVYQLIRYHFYWEPSFEKAIYGMSAGFGEESMLRVSMVPIAMGFFRSRKRVWLVPVLTGLLFGVTHLGNIAEGASVTNGVIQAVTTSLVGIYFGALFVATGSTLPGIVTHSLFDFVCFAGDPSLTEGIMTGTLPPSEIVFNLITALALLAAGFVILKKVGAPEILRIWKEKWDQT